MNDYTRYMIIGHYTFQCEAADTAVPPDIYMEIRESGAALPGSNVSSSGQQGRTSIAAGPDADDHYHQIAYFGSGTVQNIFLITHAIIELSGTAFPFKFGLWALRVGFATAVAIEGALTIIELGPHRRRS